jgi:cell division protein FtsL
MKEPKLLNTYQKILILLATIIATALLLINLNHF